MGRTEFCPSAAIAANTIAMLDKAMTPKPPATALAAYAKRVGLSSEQVQDIPRQVGAVALLRGMDRDTLATVLSVAAERLTEGSSQTGSFGEDLRAVAAANAEPGVALEKATAAFQGGGRLNVLSHQTLVEFGGRHLGALAKDTPAEVIYRAHDAWTELLGRLRDRRSSQPLPPPGDWLDSCIREGGRSPTPSLVLRKPPRDREAEIDEMIAVLVKRGVEEAAGMAIQIVIDDIDPSGPAKDPFREKRRETEKKFLEWILEDKEAGHDGWVELLLKEVEDRVLPLIQEDVDRVRKGEKKKGDSDYGVSGELHDLIVHAKPDFRKKRMRARMKEPLKTAFAPNQQDFDKNVARLRLKIIGGAKPKPGRLGRHSVLPRLAKKLGVPALLGAALWSTLAFAPSTAAAAGPALSSGLASKAVAVTAVETAGGGAVVAGGVGATLTTGVGNAVVAKAMAALLIGLLSLILGLKACSDDEGDVLPDEERVDVAAQDAGALSPARHVASRLALPTAGGAPASAPSGLAPEPMSDSELAIAAEWYDQQPRWTMPSASGSPRSPLREVYCSRWTGTLPGSPPEPNGRFGVRCYERPERCEAAASAREGLCLRLVLSDGTGLQITPTGGGSMYQLAEERAIWHFEDNGLAALPKELRGGCEPRYSDYALLIDEGDRWVMVRAAITGSVSHVLQGGFWLRDRQTWESLVGSARGALPLSRDLGSATREESSPFLVGPQGTVLRVVGGVCPDESSRGGVEILSFRWADTGVARAPVEVEVDFGASDD